MFIYYGGKGNLAKFYPAPKYDVIVEPFCGAARYTIQNLPAKAILVDKYEAITSIWRFFQDTNKEEIAALPSLFVGEMLNDYVWPCEGARNFAGFYAGEGGATPSNKIKKFGKHGKGYSSKFEFAKKRLVTLLDEIKKYEIINGNYTDCPDVEATWFIDPPYQFGGKHYRHNNIDYGELWEWCKTRKGQVIVCENDKNTWLPNNAIFVRSQKGLKYVTNEVYWCND